MKNNQSKVIAAMVVLAIAFGGFVVLEGRGGARQAGHGEAAAHGEKDGRKEAEGNGEAGKDGEHAGEKHGEEHDEKHAGEGMIPFTDEQVRIAGITLQTAAAAHLDTFIRMPGQIALNEDHTAHVTSRASGTVERVGATLGQQVRKGEVLVVIASAEIAGQRAALAAAEKRLAYARSVHASEKTLWEEKISARQDYLKAESELREAEIAVQGARQTLAALGGQGGGAGGSNRLQVRAPFGGTVVEKHVAQGEVVGADTRIFTVSDLSTVWADVVVPAKDLEIVRVGTEAVIRSVASDTTAPGKVSFVSSLIGEESRSAKARVVLANPKAAWRPGLFVNVDIVTGSAQVPVAVSREALQTAGGRQVVFKRVGQGFVAQPVSVGRSDGRLVEIVSGIEAGERYAGAGSFAIKAEQAKGDAGHAH